MEVGIQVVGSWAVIIDHDDMLMAVRAHSVTTRKSRGRRVEEGGRLYYIILLLLLLLLAPLQE